MAEIWGAVVAVAGAAYSANRQAAAGRQGAQAQQQASAENTAEQQRQFNITQQNMQPWLQTGGWALGQQQNALNGDWSGFQNSPDYAFAVQQGFQGLDAGAAANGNLWGGGADADRIALGQGLATQQFGNYWNRLAGLSGTGQSTANQLGGFGQSYANQVGANNTASAQARASSYANSANAWGNFANQAAGAFGEWYGNRRTN